MDPALTYRSARRRPRGEGPGGAAWGGPSKARWVPNRPPSTVRRPRACHARDLRGSARGRLGAPPGKLAPALRRCQRCWPPGLALIAAVALCTLAVPGRTQPAENIARGCPYTMVPAPSYGLCTDPGDATQLTDGVYSEGYFWAQPTTVGWQGVPLVLVTIDLGSTQPVSGISYNTAAGVAQVGWPQRVVVAFSDNGLSWRSPGDLVVLSAPNGGPPAEGYGVHKYVVTDLKSRGRYVRLGIVFDGSYSFCDEIEVYKGPDSLLQGEPTDPVSADPDVGVPAGWSNVRTGVYRRLASDLIAARAAIDASPLPDQQKRRLRDSLAPIDEQLLQIPEPDTASRAVLPLSDTHARVLATYAPLMQAQGLPPFLAWRKHRYDPLTPHETPTATPAPPDIEIRMMGGEFRADAFLLTNATPNPVTATIRVEGLPGAPQPPWLRVSSVPWTDTAQRVPVAAALPDADFADGAYHADVPGGMTRKVWLTVDSRDLEPGNHEGTLSIEAGDYRARLPLSVSVSNIRMGRPRLSLGMWDYTAGNGAYGITPLNRASAIELERSHFVDTPWAQAQVLPWPSAADFDEENGLGAPLSFDAFDEWVGWWPDARRYFVFAAVGREFAGADMEAPEFAPRVGAWAQALSQHVWELGLEPGQLGLLLVDEPYSDEQDAIIAAWARAINAAAPELTLFQDPVWERPDQTKTQDAITLIDVLCPNVSIFYKGGPDVARYFEQRRAEGQTLWFYQCSGPARQFDPSRYHRLQAWHAFRYGAQGIGFWSFGDTGGAQSSWNEYAGARVAFAPAFIGVDDATDGIHWQAVREGIEDYEYLAMLREAAERTPDAALRAEAEQLLAEAPAAVIGDYSPDYKWSPNIDRSAPDVYRLRALSLLERML